MTNRVIVTAGLPYANGSLHMGHLVEYCQADMYVRALKRMGKQAIYICADDAHGTPIEVRAGREGITPESLVQRYHEEHKRDFARFDVAFDHFSITHSATNRALVESVYDALRVGGQLDEREVDGNFCEHDQRFLPDRYIKGMCPKCSAPDQYGDVCEACGSTYGATELKQPYCVLCGNTPIIKPSTHIFFRLSAPDHIAFLQRFIDSGALQADVANYVRRWIEGGLRDWCISRDGPYFGFAIPDHPGKFFYVWLDAPLGYIASSMEWGAKHGFTCADLWQSANTRIEHVIGKDIVYFHTLFWPAVLQSIGYTVPSKVHVHGMLTVNGEKMSKSRGTFINAATFADHVDPQALRFYYACKYSAQSDDLDLSLDDFVLRINGELVNKHANLFSRVSQFLCNKLDGRLGDLPFTQQESQQPAPDGDKATDLHANPRTLAQQVVAHGRRIEALYAQREFGHVIRELGMIADIGNEFMQTQKPWDQLKSDPEQARLTCTFVVNVCHALAMYLWPIVPRFAEQSASILASHIQTMDASTLFAERNRPVGTMQRLFDRIERSTMDNLVEAAKQLLPQEKPPVPTHRETAHATPSSPVAAPTDQPAVVTPFTPLKASIDYDTFAQLDLRVGRVISAEPVPKSKKLLRLQVDLGEDQPRQILAGLALTYSPERIVNTQVIVVANLKPAKIMGLESQGMVLAAGEDPSALGALSLLQQFSPGTTVR